MSEFYNSVLEVLKQDERFFSVEGTLLRNSVYEAAMQMDTKLLKLLLGNPETKEAFFTNIDGTLVFDKIKFGWVINNRQFLPDSYTRFQNKIGLTDENGNLFSSSGNVQLVFPYKDCVLEGGQTKEEQKRPEVFYNETLAPDEVDRLLFPKTFTSAVRYDSDGAHPADDFEKDDNLIIKGNNLLALASMQKRFEGQVKCIYIDPPYFFRKTKATDTFKYNSNFHLSTWLVFMKNRLEMAKRLLCKGGTIWISISDDGMHYLKVLTDDIFGSDHFVGTIPRRTRNGKSDVPFNFSQDFDWLLVYTNVADDDKSVVGRKVERKYYETPDFPGRPWRLADLTKQTTAKERQNSFFTMVDPKTGKEYPASEKRTWCITKETFPEYYAKGYIVFPDDYEFLDISQPYSRKFKDEDDKAGKLSAVISDFQMQDFLKAVLAGSKNADGNDQIDDLFGREEFDYAKPENLVKAIFDVSSSEGDLVMDFFLGSGTTAAVAHKMGRRYIGIEQLDYINLSVERLRKVVSGEQGGISQSVNWHGGGSFVYCELAKLNQNFVDKIEAAVDDGTIANIYRRIVETGFISSKVSPNDIDAAADDFAALCLEDKKRFLMELLDKNLLYVNLCDLDDEEFAISDADKAFTKSFYRRCDSVPV